MSHEWWTTERQEALRSLVSQGISDPEIGRRLGRNRSAIIYARTLFGIQTVRPHGVNNRVRAVPDDFEEVGPTLTNEACARHYGVASGTSRKWYTLKGLEPAKQKGIRKRSYDRMEVLSRKTKAFRQYAAGPVAILPQHDPSLEGRAQRHLQHWCAVYRASTLNPDADKDLWIVGGRHLNTEAMIEMAERQGFQKSWAA